MWGKPLTSKARGWTGLLTEDRRRVKVIQLVQVYACNGPYVLLQGYNSVDSRAGVAVSDCWSLSIVFCTSIMAVFPSVNEDNSRVNLTEILSHNGCA